MKVQIIEADRICSPYGYDRLVPDVVQGHNVYSIVQGVETDKDGMVVAYWICNRHPHSSLAVQSGTLEWTRVEVYGTARRNVLHVMTRERAGQLRGVPILAPVLETLKQLGRYTQAEIDAAVISAFFTVLVKPASVQNGPPIGQYVPQEAQGDSADPGSIEMGTASVLALNPGDDVAFADPSLAVLPNGTKVRNYGYYTLTGGVKWLYVQVTYNGITYTGFMSSQYLRKQ